MSEPYTIKPTFNNLRPGQHIAFLIPGGIGRNGREWSRKTGRVVMAFSTHVVVNAGGRHGTPRVVSGENFLETLTNNKA